MPPKQLLIASSLVWVGSTTLLSAQEEKTLDLTKLRRPPTRKEASEHKAYGFRASRPQGPPLKLVILSLEKDGTGREPVLVVVTRAENVGDVPIDLPCTFDPKLDDGEGRNPRLDLYLTARDPSDKRYFWTSGMLYGSKAVAGTTILLGAHQSIKIQAAFAVFHEPFENGEKSLTVDLRFAARFQGGPFRTFNSAESDPFRYQFGGK